MLESQVANGYLTENVVRSRELVFPNNTCWEPYTSRKWWPKWTAPRGKAYTYAAFPSDEVPANICADWQSHSHSAFWINEQDSWNLQVLAAELFTASHETYIVTELNSQPTSATALGQLLYSVNRGYLSQDLEAVATSTTNMVRQSVNTTAVAGTVWTTEVYIHVNWAWLVYPVALLLLAILFLVGTMVSSARGSRAVWKSSSLALLLHGLTGWEANAEVFSSAGMKHQAAQIRAQLRENKAGGFSLERE
jgi:hypothetical protein